MPLSGEEMLKLFQKTGWVIMNRKGSHVKVGKNGFRETIPLHKELACPRPPPWSSRPPPLSLSAPLSSRSRWIRKWLSPGSCGNFAYAII